MWGIVLALGDLSVAIQCEVLRLLVLVKVLSSRQIANSYERDSPSREVH